MSKLIDIQDLSKHFRVEGKNYQALFDLNLQIFEKETLGLVGESGCGKSLVARTLLQLEKKESGRIFYRGIDMDTFSSAKVKKWRKNCQIIFQDPYSALNPRMKIKDLVAEPMIIHKLFSGKEKEEKVEELLRKVGLKPEDKGRYPHEFSGGQRQRIGIARALAVDPEFIVCDEPISSLDVSIQAQIINLLKELQEEKGLTYLFISHDLSMVKYLSQRVAVMYLGHIVEVGTSEEIYKNPLHPYTQALLSSIPYPDPKLERKRNKIVLTGDVPSILKPFSGCPFHTRCPKAFDLCRVQKPQKKIISPTHTTYCHLF